MFVPTLEHKGALKLFGNKFLNKCVDVSHFHSLPLQLKKTIEKKKTRNKTTKRKTNKERRVDRLIHLVDCQLYEKMISRNKKRS